MNFCNYPPATEMTNIDIKAVYEVLSRHVGHTYQRDLGEIRAMDLQRFAVAVSENLPITVEPTAAAVGLSAIAAPPLFLSAVLGWEAGPAETALLPDGTPPAGVADLPVEGLRLMGGGQSLEFFHPVVAGIRVVQETHITDIKLKEGRSGHLLLIQVERLFLSNGQPLIRCVETFIGR